MSALLGLIDRLRRPPGVVLWGGRPGIDRQLGSRADRREVERELYLAKLRREQAQRIATMSEAMRRSMRALGVAFTVHADGIRRAAPERAGLTVEAIEREHRRREALSRAAARARADTVARDLIRARNLIDGGR